MPDFVADLFDRVAAGYDESIPFFATFGHRLVNWVSPAFGARILDLGAGRGAITLAIAKATSDSCSVLAADISPEMVATLSALRLAGVTTQVLDAQALDLPDESFDVVFSGFVFHILADPAAALAEVFRVLRPGGVFAMSVPGPSSDGGWWSTYGQIVAAFAARLEQVHPAGMTPGSASWEQRAADAGLRTVGGINVEIVLPISGPSAHWRWLMSHGNRWLYDALDESNRDEFKRQVLHSLLEHHPAQGTKLIAGADFWKMIKS